MKKINFLIVLLLSCEATYAQIYFPFPDSNAIWQIEFGGYQCSCCASYHYSFDGDTVINLTTYHKIHQNGIQYADDISGNCTSNFLWYIDSYSGAFRTNNIQKKVWIIPRDSTSEVLLYDFNLMVGDSISGLMKQNTSSTDTISVIAIDSILIGTQYRKRWSFVLNSVGNIQNQIIEGIGNTGGLLEPLFTFEFGGILSCFQQNGQVIYPDTTTICLFTGINELTSQLENINIYPNPITDKLTITTTNNTPSEIILYDIVSRKLLQQKFTSSVTLNTAQLTKGIYIYEVRGKENVVKKGKVVKE